ncbi:MAG: hypothetical protein E6K80_05650 [Candidatus Eisenbacteria bacterium]|uniref:Periplasmic heavy metal sensor n=1 Tax=Eiseniibacteriota bacterium TaxID=2212470 RepID=A0A538U687_UNCEI|nr:MAG: hypothetical protein E6K80_05650 [Candidatus Eisenbacteria bacterium]
MRGASVWTTAFLAAVLLLATSATGRQTSHRSRSARGVDSVLARVGKETITTGQVQRRLDELPEHVRPQFSTPEGRQRLVDRLIEEKVWLVAAMKKGVDKRPDVQRQIEQSRRDLLIRTLINDSARPPRSR